MDLFCEQRDCDAVTLKNKFKEEKCGGGYVAWGGRRKAKRHTVVVYYCTILLCHTDVPWYHTDVPCCSTMLLCHALVPCFCTMPLHHAVVPCRCTILLCHTVVLD